MTPACRGAALGPAEQHRPTTHHGAVGLDLPLAQERVLCGSGGVCCGSALMTSLQGTDILCSKASPGCFFQAHQSCLELFCSHYLHLLASLQSALEGTAQIFTHPCKTGEL